MDLPLHGAAPALSATLNCRDLVRDAQVEQADAARAARPWRDVIRGRLAWVLVGLGLWSLWGRFRGRLFRHLHPLAAQG